jgi:putative heme iron utilization protein
LNQNSKASLLIAETGDGNPLALGRVTLVGECHEITGEEREPAKKAFLEAHESASVYADWDDFAFFRLSVESVRYIGGFGRMSWVSGSKWSDAEADPVDEFSEDIITHMNEDHADALVLYCKAMSKAADTSEAVMTGIDRYGFEMLATTESGKKPIRLAFGNEVKNSDEARVELVKLVREARTILK